MKRFKVTKKMKNAKAITLVALMVTIIVLLILAGIAISTLTGENSLLNRAKISKEKHLQSETEEKLKIKIMTLQTDIMQKEKREASLEDIENWKNQESDYYDSEIIGITNSTNNGNKLVSIDTYTFEVVGTDVTSLKTGLTLNASNAPITVNGSTASVTYGSGQYSNSNKTVTFKITVRNYSGGKIVMNIKAGALQDNGNPVNSSVAQNYTMDPQTDFTAPVWNGSINNGKLSGSTYTLNLIGTDETKLQQTTLSTSNVSVTVGGKSASFSFSNRGQGQLSNNNKTITFGMTISNFTGGNVTITINAGALKDAAGNSSVKKSYSFSVDATPPVWNGSINNGKLSGSTYTLNLIGTDETKLQQTTLST